MAEQERLGRSSTIDVSQTMSTHDEKDEYIEKLRRRHIKYKEKIKVLEDNNADFYKTIQKQQEVLENMEQNLDAQKVQFRKEQRELRARKNGEILRIKKALMKERGWRTELEKKMGISNNELPGTPLVLKSESSSNVANIAELESLRRDNSRLEEQMENMAKELDKVKNVTLPQEKIGLHGNDLAEEYRKMEEEYKRRLAEKDVELRTVREELLDATTEEVDNKGYRQLLDDLDQYQRKNTDLSTEANRLQNERDNTIVKLEAVEAEKLRLESLLGEVREDCRQLTIQVTDYKTQLEDAKRECEERIKKANELEQSNKFIKIELDVALKETFEKSRQLEEVCNEQNRLKVELVELGIKEEKARIKEQECSDQMRQEKAEFQNLLLKFVEERKAEVAALVRGHELEKEKLCAELEIFREEKEWVAESKIATLNSIAVEIERLRKAQTS